jgi:hypothetical protein
MFGETFFDIRNELKFVMCEIMGNLSSCFEFLTFDGVLGNMLNL